MNEGELVTKGSPVEAEMEVSEVQMQDEEVHMNSSQKEALFDDFSFPPLSIENKP